ncbi:hypothetical protein H8D64_01875 [PVC group bacterium]|nr:hypothetical protein [PVC group bacterium]
METGILKLDGAEARYSILKDTHGHWMQFCYTLVPENPEQIANQIRIIEKAEGQLYKTFKIKNETALLKRFFSSDLINHREDIIRYKERQNTDFYLSLIEQPPAPAVKLALFGMCLSNITGKARDDNAFCCETTSGLRHIFIEHLADPDPVADSALQTERIFSLLRERLSKCNATIENNVLRTWIYAPHIDADYSGIVKARKELFDAINLTKDTHYIASTGIQGSMGDQFARVSMDAYAVTGLDETKIRYIQAPEYLSPTHVYGVTFERATMIEMGNTEWLTISGTASIDNNGEVVHPGDIVKQTERTLANISALLDAADFEKEDLSSFMVYLRDPADYSFVKPLLDNYAETLPTVCVGASVCRPGWLIEIEATAGRIIV